MTTLADLELIKLIGIALASLIFYSVFILVVMYCIDLLYGYKESAEGFVQFLKTIFFNKGRKNGK